MSQTDAGGTPLSDANLFITISGPPGCGGTTLAEGLAETLDCGYASGGEVFREIAEERDLSLTQLVAKAGEDDEIDRTLDRRLQKIAEKWGTANNAFVLESRLAGWIAGNRADFRIWLDAPDHVRVERTSERDEMGAEMQVREVIEEDRYETYYDIDLADLSIYDICLNTARWSPDSVRELVLTAIREYDPAVDEGAITIPDLDI